MQKQLSVQTRPKHIRAKEWRRLQALTQFEAAARLQGHILIAGVDEVGRGPLAGPVVSAVCIIPEDVFLPGINDSKKLTAEMREALFQQIAADKRIHYAVGLVPHDVIDQINIYQATIQSMLQAISKLMQQPDLLLVDGLKLPHPSIPCQKIIGGDQKSQSIAAASVIAKVTRDQLMCEYHLQWPQYGFDSHKGYSTPQHLKALVAHGPCPIHRLSFKRIHA